MLPVHRLRAEDEIRERQREERPHLVARPVVPHGGIVRAMSHAGLLLPWRPARKATSPSPQAEGTRLISLDRFAQEKLAELEARQPAPPRSPRRAREDGIWVERGGRRLLSFSCNDYLNLTQHPRGEGGGGRGDRALWRRRRRVAARHRQPSALCARSKSGSARLKGTEAALRLRLGLSRQCRDHSGARRRRTIWCWSTSCRMPASGPGAQLARGTRR